MKISDEIKTISLLACIAVGLFVVVAFLLYLLVLVYGDITFEGLGESIGGAVREFESGYEKGKGE